MTCLCLFRENVDDESFLILVVGAGCCSVGGGGIEETLGVSEVTDGEILRLESDIARPDFTDRALRNRWSSKPPASVGISCSTTN